jgi:hypothetical protein
LAKSGILKLASAGASAGAKFAKSLLVRIEVGW